MAEAEEMDAPVTTNSVGQRLRAAREAKKLTLEEVASQTRIPLRHLEAIEAGEWDRLPAPTYTIGFAKSYASAVGLDRNEVGESVREEVGSTRPAVVTNEVFEPADPARAMPRWLVIGAIVGIVLVVIAMTWLNSRALEEPQGAEVAAVEEEAPEIAVAPAAQQAQAMPEGPVILTATDPVWLQVYERGGRTLFQGELATGQRYEVPRDAEDPLLRTGKPEALRVTVGGRMAPPVGPPARTVRDVSLTPSSLMGEDAPQGGQPGGQATAG